MTDWEEILVTDWKEMLEQNAACLSDAGRHGESADVLGFLNDRIRFANRVRNFFLTERKTFAMDPNWLGWD